MVMVTVQRGGRVLGGSRRCQFAPFYLSSLPTIPFPLYHLCSQEMV